MTNRYRHRVTRNVYMIEARIPLQCSTYKPLDGQELIIYRDVLSNETYARLSKEFFDGRFIAMPGEEKFDMGYFMQHYCRKLEPGDLLDTCVSPEQAAKWVQAFWDKFPNLKSLAAKYMEQT